MSFFPALPSELQLLIFSSLAPTDIANAARSCRDLNAAIRTHRHRLPRTHVELEIVAEDQSDCWAFKIRTSDDHAAFTDRRRACINSLGLPVVSELIDEHGTAVVRR